MHRISTVTHPQLMSSAFDTSHWSVSGNSSRRFLKTPLENTCVAYSETIFEKVSSNDKYLLALVRPLSVEGLGPIYKTLSLCMDNFKSQFEDFNSRAWTKESKKLLVDKFQVLIGMFNQCTSDTRLQVQLVLDVVHPRLLVLCCYFKMRLGIVFKNNNPIIREATKNWQSLINELQKYQSNSKPSNSYELNWYIHFAQFFALYAEKDVSEARFLEFVDFSNSMKTTILREAFVKHSFNPDIANSEVIQSLMEHISIYNLTLYKQLAIPPTLGLYEKMTWKSDVFQVYSGTYPDLCHEYIVNHSLGDHEVFKFDVDDNYLRIGIGEQVGVMVFVDFDEPDLVLDEMPEFYFILNLYGHGLSIRRIFAQLTLMQLTCKIIPEDSDCSETQLDHINQNFLGLLERFGWSNSGSELVAVDTWDTNIVQRLFRMAVEKVLQRQLPKKWEKKFDVEQFKKGAKKNELYNHYLSGLVQHEAIAIYLSCIDESKLGLTGQSYKDVIHVLKNTLQVSLKAALISQSTTHQAQQYIILAKQIYRYMAKNKHIIIPTGFMVMREGFPLKHAVYVGIKRLDDQLQFTITNGGDGVMENQRYLGLKPNEMPYCYYSETDPNRLNYHDNEDRIIEYLSNLLRAPYLNTSSRDDIYDGQFRFQNSKQNLPMQPIGNCTIHNLKYSLKQLLGMNELDFGNLASSTLIGMGRFIKKLKEADQSPLLSEDLYTQLSRISTAEARTVEDIERRKKAGAGAQFDHIIPQNTLNKFRDLMLRYQQKFQSLYQHFEHNYNAIGLLINKLQKNQNYLLDMPALSTIGHQQRIGDPGNCFDPEYAVSDERVEETSNSMELRKVDLYMTQLCNALPGKSTDFNDCDELVLKWMYTRLAVIFNKLEAIKDEDGLPYDKRIWGQTGNKIYKKSPGVHHEESIEIAQNPVFPTFEAVQFTHKFTIESTEITQDKKKKTLVLKSLSFCLEVEVDKTAFEHIYNRHVKDCFSESKPINSFWGEDPKTFIESKAGQALISQDIEYILRAQHNLESIQSNFDSAQDFDEQVEFDSDQDSDEQIKIKRGLFHAAHKNGGNGQFFFIQATLTITTGETGYVIHCKLKSLVKNDPDLTEYFVAEQIE